MKQWIRVKFNITTSQAIVLMLQDDEQGDTPRRKFMLTNSGEWQEVQESQPQEIIRDVRIYTISAEDDQ